MAYSLIWLPEVLKAANLKVAEVPGWTERGRGSMGEVVGVVCHHTATKNPNKLNMPTLKLIRDGRSDLAGPLSQLGLGLDGTFYVIAAGRANHAGLGAWGGFSGNSRFIGIEAENSGLPGDDWPDVQMDAYRRGVAAILTRLGKSADMCCGHKEYAPGRKTDPTFDMKAFRDDVRAIMRGAGPVRPMVPAETPLGTKTLRRGDRGDLVKALQTGIGARPADGVFGPATEARLRQFQRDHDLVADGIAGPRTWEAIGEPPPAAAAPPPAEATAVTTGLVTPAALKAVAPNAPADLIGPLALACAKFEINTPTRVAMFLAQCAHESGGFRRKEEGLVYTTAKRARAVFPDRFPTEASAAPYLNNAEKFANKVYAHKIGNGDEASGDGYRFRGGGFIQLTGRENFTGFARSVGRTPEDAADYARTTEGACMTAGWYWKDRNLSKWADADDFEEVTRRINAKKLGLKERKDFYAKARAALGI